MRPVGVSGLLQVLAYIKTTTVFQISTHCGQNRDQKTGAPVRRRDGDEIALLLREVVLPAAKLTIRQSGLSMSLSDTIRNATKPVSSPQDPSASIPENGRIVPIPQQYPLSLIIGGRRGGDTWGNNFAKSNAHLPLGPGKSFLGPREGRSAKWKPRMARPGRPDLVVR